MKLKGKPFEFFWSLILLVGLIATGAVEVCGRVVNTRECGESDDKVQQKAAEHC